MTDDAEITLETNPGTVDRAKLGGMLTAGVNRLSVGIQSFHADELKFLTRIHDAETARRCVRDAFDAGFTNLNIDLIYALPDQTTEKWDRTIAEALALRPQHISAYCLIYEEGTPLIRLLRSKQITPLPGDDEAGLYEFTMQRLGDAGYDHYEISNYSRPGFRCRHNLTYWEHQEYISFGPSAHSFRAPRRWWNVSNISTYLAKLSQGELPIAGEELLSGRELFEEKVMLGLRMGRLDLETTRRETGNDILAASGAFIGERPPEDWRWWMPARSGSRGNLMVCDEVSARIIADASGNNLGFGHHFFYIYSSFRKNDRKMINRLTAQGLHRDPRRLSQTLVTVVFWDVGEFHCGETPPGAPSPGAPLPLVGRWFRWSHFTRILPPASTRSPPSPAP